MFIQLQYILERSPKCILFLVVFLFSHTVLNYFYDIIVLAIQNS